MSEQHTELQWLRGILWAILFISLCGMTFSGTLTYREVFGTAASCPSPGAAGTIFGYPACVYGLVMYAILTAMAGWGLMRHRSEDRPARAVEDGGTP